MMKTFSSSETLKILNNILDIDSHLRGLAYLEKICLNIYKYFELEYIIIGKAVQPENTKAETIIALVNGVISDNFTYELQHSPCENVYTGKEVCVYENNVMKKFERHNLITDLGIEAYVGSPLMQDNNFYGLLVFLDTNAIEHPDYYESLIGILSSRISVEIERYVNDQMVISLQQKNIELNTKNQLDNLTGAYNRHFFSLYVEDIIRNGTIGTLLFLDLDDFKQINDIHGHQVGDTVLERFSKAVQSVIRKNDIFARYGGEEFILFLPDADKETTLSITQRIHETLYFQTSDKSNIPKVTVSIGAYVMHDKKQSLEVLTKHADAALYEAKSLGKNQTVFS